MTERNHKLRAVFLAAIMFLWLFAGTVAFAGSAAADNHAVINDVDPDPLDLDTTAANEVTVDVAHDEDDPIRVVIVPDGETEWDDDNPNYVTEADPDGGTSSTDVVVDASTLDDGAYDVYARAGTDADDALSQGESVEWAGEASLQVNAEDSEISGWVNDGQDGIEDAEVTIDGENYQGESVTDSTDTDESGDYEFTELRAGTYDVTATADGYESLTVPDVEVNHDDTDNDVDFLLGEDIDGDEDTIEDVGDTLLGSVHWQGQILVADLDDSVAGPEDQIDIREADLDGGLPTDSSYATSTTVRSDNSIVIRSSRLDSEDYVLYNDDESHYIGGDLDATRDSLADMVSGESFEIATQDLDVEFEDDEVSSGADIDFEFDSNRGGYDAVISEEDGELDEDDLLDIFDEWNPVEEDDDEVRLEELSSYTERAANFTDIDEGNYTFVVEVVDTTAEDTASIEVTGEVADDVSFEETQIDQNRGDIAEINISTTGLDDGERVIVTIGDHENDGYQLNASAEVSDDELSLMFNTYLAGKSDDPEVDNEDILWAQEGEVDHSEFEESVTDLEVSLGAGLYDIVAMEYEQDWETDDPDQDEYAVSVLNLHERSTDDISTYTAPDGSAEDLAELETLIAGMDAGNVTESDTVAIADEDREDGDDRNGDVVIHQIGVSGLFGAISEEPSAEDLLANENDLFTLTYDHLNPSANRAPMELSGDFDDWHIVRDDSNNTVYAVVEAEDIEVDNGAEDDTVFHDAEFDVTYNVSHAFLEGFTYDDLDSDDSEIVNDSYEFVDREASFDTSDGIVQAPPSDDAEISGDTTVAPGTELRVRSRATGESPFLRTDDAEVDADGNFAGEFDFSDVDVGQEFTATIRGEAFEDDVETDGEIGEGVGAVFDVSDLDPTDVEVEYEDDFEVSANVSNSGDESSTQEIELRVDGDVVDSEDLELEPGESATVELTGTTDDVTEESNDFGVYSADDEETGSLTVNNVPETDDDDADDTADDTDDQAGFGAVVALIALLAAALVAARRHSLN